MMKTPIPRRKLTLVVMKRRTRKKTKMKEKKTKKKKLTEKKKNSKMTLASRKTKNSQRDHMLMAMSSAVRTWK